VDNTNNNDIIIFNYFTANPPIYFTFIKYSQRCLWCLFLERNSHSPLPLRKRWVGTHPTNQTKNMAMAMGNGKLTLFRSRGRSVARGLSIKMNGQGERKGNAHHHQINSTQSKSSHHPSNKQTSNAKNESKSNQFLSKKNTHNFFFFLLCDRCSTFIRPFQ
jgi:hypothetical protein